MTNHSSPRSALILLAGLAFGCGGSVAPESLGSTYVLKGVANDPLPAVLATNEYGTIHVYSQSLYFRPDGTGVQSEVSEMIPHRDDLPREGPVAGQVEFRWVMTAGRILIEHVCPPNANCVSGPALIADIQGQTLQAIWGPMLRGRAPLHYAEVPSTQ